MDLLSLLLIARHQVSGANFKIFLPKKKKESERKSEKSDVKPSEMCSLLICYLFSLYSLSLSESQN